MQWTKHMLHLHNQIQIHTRYVGLEAFGTNRLLVVEIKQATYICTCFHLWNLDANV
jgi:hypothetical protein